MEVPAYQAPLQKTIINATAQLDITERIVMVTIPAHTYSS